MGEEGRGLCLRRNEGVSMEGIVKEVRECARNYRKKKGRKNDASGDELPVHKQLKGSLNKCRK